MFTFKRLSKSFKIHMMSDSIITILNYIGLKYHMCVYIYEHMQGIMILPLKNSLQTMSLSSYWLYVNQYTQIGDLVRVDRSQ